MENLHSKKRIFQIILKNFATVGIEPKLKTQAYPLNGRILIGFCLLTLSMICSFEYTFFEAKTFIGYTQTAFMGSAVVVLILVLLILILNVEELFKFINDCENLVNLSEYARCRCMIYRSLSSVSKPISGLQYSSSAAIFTTAIQSERAMSKLLFFAMARVTPACLYIPWLIYTFFNYFFLSFGANAFELPFPIW